MELDKELLVNEIAKRISRAISEKVPDARQLEIYARIGALQALCEIKEILENKKLSASDCVKNIIRVFDNTGLSCRRIYDKE